MKIVCKPYFFFLTTTIETLRILFRKTKQAGGIMIKNGKFKRYKKTFIR